MVENSFAGMPDALAEILAQRGLADRQAREKSARRAASGVAVAVLHVVLIFIFLVSERIPIARHVAQPIETIVMLQPPQAPIRTPPPQRIIVVPLPETVPEIRVQPITPVTPPPTQTKEGDVLKALGIAIACGASHYEYLSPAERRLCPHAPWKIPPDKNLAIAPPPPPPIGQLTGAEAEARFRETAKPCPILQNTPCIDKVIYGNGPH